MRRSRKKTASKLGKTFQQPKFIVLFTQKRGRERREKQTLSFPLRPKWRIADPATDWFYVKKEIRDALSTSAVTDISFNFALRNH